MITKIIWTKNVFKKWCSSHWEISWTKWFRISRRGHDRQCQIESLQIRSNHSMRRSTIVISHQWSKKRRRKIIFFPVVFCSSVLTPNLSVNCMIHKRCIKLVYLVANQPLCLLILFSLLCWISWYLPLKIILKQLFVSGSVSHGEYSPWFTLPSANNS